MASKTHSKSVFEPITDRLIIPSDRLLTSPETLSDYQTETLDIRGAKFRRPSFQTTHRRLECGETIFVETMHISCKSDTYEPGHNYGGVIIYQYDGKSEWRTANNTHCKPGYIVIQDTESEMVKRWKNEPGVVHGAVYRNAFGESVNYVHPLRQLVNFLPNLFSEEVTTCRIVGEGFSIQDGVFEVNSRVFNNPRNSEYHDSMRRMSPYSAHCVRKVVEYWKTAGPCWINQQNFEVKQLLEDFDLESNDCISD